MLKILIKVSVKMGVHDAEKSDKAV